MSRPEPHPARAWASLDVLAAALYSAAIFVIGSLPATPAVARGVSDKIQHALGFALLAWLSCRAVRRLRSSWTLPRLLVSSAAFSILIGGALELWQGLLGYRSCELLDWVADGLGAGIGVGVYAGLDALFGERSRAAS
jgi:VanZ family protein